ncbi:MAG TPA: hypothetical protein VMR81_07090 [Patescibacteria group bacterium]|nr:hypothetical protein [Patescibacteria group bacterium]
MNIKRILLILVLVLTASFARLYRISDLTQFLGDQGRDGVAIMNFVTQRQFPVYGPPLSTGQYTGPFYYYFIAPSFILSHFNPVVPAIEMSIIEIFSVILMLMLASSLFGFSLGYGVSMLYALSPMLIHQDRILWPPTTVPFFTLLVLNSIYLMSRNKYWAIVLLMLSDVILIQLHYANGILIIASFVYLVITFIEAFRNKLVKTYLVWLIVAVLLGILSLFPFLIYEWHKGFIDITGSLVTFSKAKGLAFSKHVYINNVITLCSWLGNYLLPILQRYISLIFVVIILFIAFLSKRKSARYISLFVLFSIAILAFYQDKLQRQYAYSLIPFVFLLLGEALYVLARRIPNMFVYGIIIILAFTMVLHTDLLQPGNRDILRAKINTDAIIRLAGGKPFSFTIISSPSFSDFHYRFFFMLRHIAVQPIDTKNYNLLFLVCESGQCPTIDEIHMNERIYTMCYDFLCKFDYPILDIWKWKNVGSTRVGVSTIYEYEH